ncbi:MAG: polyribonucleotide nucleotidyltransferase [Actinomycetota bacterium]|nr:polyribonucleotide nucleotidyltransferase [Actinomycetota bacterium]
MGRLGTIEHTVTVDGRSLRFEGGRLAQQAGGSVVASMGDTTVLTTTTAGAVKEFLGFFPLTVDVEERMYAAGKIPGGFFKREGRPSENAILTARLIDRPLRPTFADGLRNEIQIVNTVLQTGQVDPYDVVAINASSVSTLLAGIPFDGPVAAVRYGLHRDGTWTAFPTFEDLDSDIVFQMVVAGRVDEGGDVAILMVEADATVHAWKLIEDGAPEPTEELIGDGLEQVKSVLRQLCEAQTAFVEKVGARETSPEDFPIFVDYTDEVLAHAARFEDRLREAYTRPGTKKEKNAHVAAVRDEVIADVRTNGPANLDEDERGKQAKQAFRSLEKTVVRKLVSETETRVDGRGPGDIRSLTAEVNVLDKVHGSSIFERGETQVVNVLALGALRESQRLDTLAPEEEKRYIHHYNMPPYSTGEAGRIGSPKRREIGHGLLAERAVLPVVPDEDAWPYAMRLVSEVVSSNGSTSMASVCASTLSLMDGGVPIHAPVAGIAMGLIKEGDSYTTLTDIQGVEDFFGDMDFKVAGTDNVVTALQLDTKLTGIPADVLASALLQAREARLKILEVMVATIGEPRTEVKPNAPQVMTIHIPMDKIGEVIGPKGKIIREITEETGADIDVDDDGVRGIVRIYAAQRDQADAAADRVNAIANPVVPKEGERYRGTVVKTVDFGAFVSLTPGVDGLLHISKIGQKAGKRLDHAEEALSVGDTVYVEVKEVRAGGKYSLDFVDEGQEGDGERREAEAAAEAGQRGSGERGERDRGDDRQRDRGRREGDRGDDAGRVRTRTRSRE